MTRPTPGRRSTPAASSPSTTRSSTGFIHPVLWRCPKARLVEHYAENLSARHLDIGVATGALLDPAPFPVAAPELTLMDLNPNSLAVASARLSRYAPRTHQTNVLEDWRLEPGTDDSVAMTNLLHCLPGPMAAKGVAFERCPPRPAAPGGTLFGVTILGEGRLDHNPPARVPPMRGFSNARGILDISRDDGPRFRARRRARRLSSRRARSASTARSPSTARRA